MPIVAVYSDGWKELVGGNTRLTAMLAQNKKAKVWVFKVPDEVAELAENFADGNKNEGAEITMWTNPAYQGADVDDEYYNKQPAKLIDVNKRTTIKTMKGAIISPPGNTVGFNVFEIPPDQRGKLNGTTVYHQTRKLDKVLQSGGLRPRADVSGEREFALTTIQSGRDWRTPKGIFVSTRSGEWFGDEISFKIQPSDKIYRAYSKTGHLLITNPVSADRFINAGPIKNR